ncbi:hypothetical protein BY458DRAFT_154360 [Sporodiniella umbellata]|nr:hypothetical protein BY458DRAFT_154360 [Sporodiniella umbellata]
MCIIRRMLITFEYYMNIAIPHFMTKGVIACIRLISQSLCIPFFFFFFFFRFLLVMSCYPSLHLRRSHYGKQTAIELLEEITKKEEELKLMSQKSIETTVSSLIPISRADFTEGHAPESDQGQEDTSEDEEEGNLQRAIYSLPLLSTEDLHRLYSDEEEASHAHSMLADSDQEMAL